VNIDDDRMTSSPKDGASRRLERKGRAEHRPPDFMGDQAGGQCRGCVGGRDCNLTAATIKLLQGGLKAPDQRAKVRVPVPFFGFGQ
jgi:hypothetical protein